MKCPKCGYLGIDSIDRCRHCGYEFSLLLDEDGLPVLQLRTAEADGSDADLTLKPSASAAEFSLSADDDLLIRKPSPPRAPVAVRRSTPDPARLRSSLQPKTPRLDLYALDPGDDGPRTTAPSAVLAPVAAARTPSSAAVAAPSTAEPATLAARGVAVMVDAGLLLTIDAVVVYLTMQVCGLQPADLHILPKGPLLAFLALQNLAYFVSFTMGGQTLGKMAAGIRVVSTRDHASLDMNHSLVRTLVWVGLAAPAGLGFATALMGHDHRGLHDRCAGTRVVRASD